MFCPRCSQQQALEDARFCSRCGFQLSVVSRLLTTNGILSERETEYIPQSRKSSRLGLKAIFFSIIMIPIIIGIGIIFDSPAPILIPFTFFLFGLSWTVYNRLFGEDLLALKQIEQPRVAMPRQAALPPQRVNTAEMLQPPSITENTTKLLDN
jgi:hypothetical protein